MFRGIFVFVLCATCLLGQPDREVPNGSTRSAGTFLSVSAPSLGSIAGSAGFVGEDVR